MLEATDEVPSSATSAIIGHPDSKLPKRKTGSDGGDEELLRPTPRTIYMPIYLAGGKCCWQWPSWTVGSGRVCYTGLSLRSRGDGELVLDQA